MFRHKLQNMYITTHKLQNALFHVPDATIVLQFYMHSGTIPIAVYKIIGVGSVKKYRLSFSIISKKQIENRFFLNKEKSGNGCFKKIIGQISVRTG